MSEPCFELRDVTLSVDGRTLAGPLSLRGPRGRTLVLLGPAATGKSALLRILAGEVARGPGRPGAMAWRGDASLPDARDVARVPQRAPGAEPPDWASAFEGARPLVLLDEPSSASAEAREALAKAIAAHRAAGGTTVVVTHDQLLARRVADHAILLVAGRIIEEGPADVFFESPRTALGARFVAQGNCWPAPEPPPLPEHFRWIVEGRLAGLGRPGLLGDVDEDLNAIATHGVQHLVSLTRAPFDPSRLRAFGIQGRHFPVRDMGVPSLGATAQLCAEITRRMEAGRSVALHCRAGLGRTGTILAAVLVWQGANPEDAVARIRAHRAGYIQNRAQRAFVDRFAVYAGG